MRDALRLSPEQLVSDAIANSRLEGFDVSDETRIVMKRVAVGEMSLKQLKTWENEQAVRIRPPAGG